MQFVQDASSKRKIGFSKIRHGIYNAPCDFFIKEGIEAGSLFEPLDYNLHRECGSYKSFSLTRVYEALRTSQKCDHIWEVLEPLHSISRDTDIQTLCQTKPGIYKVPNNAEIVRMYGPPVIGGIFWRLTSQELHTTCGRLFALSRDKPELMLAEIYGCLWIHHDGQEDKPRIFLEMKAMMQDWLEDTEFLNTEEGMLTKLVLKLGNHVHPQAITNLTTVNVIPEMYVFTRVLPYGMVKGEKHWVAVFHLEGKPRSLQEATGTLDALVLALCFSNPPAKKVRS